MKRLPQAIIIFFIVFILTGCSGQSNVDTNSVSEDISSVSSSKKF